MAKEVELTEANTLEQSTESKPEKTLSLEKGGHRLKGRFPRGEQTVDRFFSGSKSVTTQLSSVETYRIRRHMFRDQRDGR